MIHQFAFCFVPNWCLLENRTHSPRHPFPGGSGLGRLDNNFSLLSSQVPSPVSEKGKEKVNPICSQVRSDGEIKALLAGPAGGDGVISLLYELLTGKLPVIQIKKKIITIHLHLKMKLLPDIFTCKN